MNIEGRRSRNPLTTIKSLSVADVLISVLLVCLLATLVTPLLRVTESSKHLQTHLNLKQIGNAGYLYAADHNERVHPYTDKSYSPAAGYYVFLKTYLPDPQVMFDATRGVPANLNMKGFAWTTLVSLSVNRNGWVGFEGPPPAYASRQPRVITQQEDVALRAAYVITANYDGESSDLVAGYNYVTEEAGCAVSVQPRKAASVFNRVYLATQFHKGFILTSYGDTHVGRVPFTKVGRLNQTSTKAEDCSAHGPNNNTGIQTEIDLKYWGTWDDATR